MSIVSQTQRLRIRQWKDSDRHQFAALNNDSEVMRYFPRKFTLEESNEFIDKNVIQIENVGWGAWAVELTDLEQFIGYVGFSRPAQWHPCAGNIEIGWRLDSNYWGHGYATEAARQVLSVGFTLLAFEDIVSFTSACNHPSIKVMQKIGLRNDNVGFEHPRIDSASRLKKHVIYRLNRHQWQTDNK